MESVSWFVPILPDKVEAWKAFTEQSEARKAEHARSRRRAGITREVAALVETPQGSFTSVFLEADDVSRAMKIMLESEDPYDKWFFEKTQELHGMTREAFEAPLPSKVYFDYREETVSRPGERKSEASSGTRG
jgi:hypothetical protein